MVTLSVLLLIGFRMQIEKLRSEVDDFGLDNLLVIETVTSRDIEEGIPADRFRSLRNWGELFTIRKMLTFAKSSNGQNAQVAAYTDDDYLGLQPYLKNKHNIFVLSTKYPEGLVVEYDIEGETFSCIALQPEKKLSQLIQEDTIFLPISYIPEVSKRGYSMIYYLQRQAHSPSIPKLTEAIHLVMKADGNAKVDIQSAAMIKQRLDKLENQQSSMRIWLASIMGGAISLIYGVLSILEFRQGMYVSALLKSFGVPSSMLGIRSIIENILIVNAVTIGIIYTLSIYHNTIFKALKVSGNADINSLYWGQETLWILVAANIGVLISSIPVFLALRKQVGTILE